MEWFGRRSGEAVGSPYQSYYSRRGGIDEKGRNFVGVMGMAVAACLTMVEDGGNVV